MELNQLIILATTGDPNAQNSVGHAYEEGAGVEQDFDAALAWHNLAAMQGHVDSMFQIGRINQLGLTGESNFEEAEKWYRLALAKGHVLAKVNLGMMFVNGEGVSINYKLAENLFRDAAHQGSCDAQNNLGAMYSMGLGVTADDEQAFKWYFLAAEQGNQKAQLSLGLIYRDGIGVQQDYEKSIYWLRKSAIQGDDGAQLHLGLMLIQDEGLAENAEEGRWWLQTSAEQGNDIAKERMADMTSESESPWLDDLFTLKPMVGLSDDGTCWLAITVEEFLWSKTCNVTLGGLMRQTQKYEFDSGRFSDRSEIVNWGFQEIQISRGVPLKVGEDIVISAGDQVIVDWRTQDYPNQSMHGESRMTYKALPDGNRWGYFGDFSDYYYGPIDEVHKAVKAAKLNIVSTSIANEEIKKWYRNLIETDPNQQLGDMPFNS